MSETLDDHEGRVSIGGRRITNFRFADDIAVNAEEEEEAGVLVSRLYITTTRYCKLTNVREKMEISPDQTKVITNNLKWLPKRDQDIRAEARSSGELQVPWGNHL